MRLLDRYVAGQFLRLFLLFALSAPMLFVLFDLTDQLDVYLDRGLTPRQVAIGYVYELPLFILYAFPIAALIATIFTINGMARHSELSAAKAGGVSFYRLAAPLPVLGIVLSAAALGLSELVPVTTRLRAEVMGLKSAFRPSRTDFVYRGDDGRVFAIRRLDVEEGRIYGLSIEREGNPPATPTIHVVAQQASYRESGWVLENGYLRLLGEPGREHTMQFDSLRPAGFEETPDQLLAEPKEPEEMRYEELGHYIEILRRSGGEPLELMVERAQKIALPLATLVIILFAGPLAMSSPRGGAAYGVGVSLGITIFYLMLFKIAGAAGASGTLPPMAAAWLPNVVFLAAAGVLLSRVRT